MDMDNPIHDRPPPIGELKLLVAVGPTPGNKGLNHNFL